MAAPMLVPLILLGGATIALAAASSKKKAAQPPPTSGAGGGKTYTLDANMPPALRDQVLAALATEQDPQKLEAFASAIEVQYPTAAAALRVKEAVLRAQLGLPTAPSASPPRTGPIPHSPVDPGPLPPLPLPIDPGVFPTPSIPAAPPIPAAPAAPPAVPAAPPTPAVPTAPAQPPVPSLPALPPLLGGLDPGMPIEVQRAVVGALTTENDPAKLEGFASAIQAQYPIAAGLLMAKAQALRLSRPPAAPVPSAPAPAPASPAFPIPPPGVLPPTPAPVATGGTYTVLSGDFPIKIAKKLTGDPNRWHELIAANPNKKTGKDGNFVSLLPGEVLRLPLSWGAPAAPALPLPASPPPSAAPTLPGLPFPLPSGIPGIPGVPSIPGIPGVPAVFHPPSPAPASASADSYTVQGGDSPIKIAKKLTGDGNRWHELIAANPTKKTGKDGNFVSLLPGEILHLPAAWVTTAHTATPVLAAAHGGSDVAHA